jgi:hypothetical protein
VEDGNIAGEIPLLSSFLYLLGEAERMRRSLTSGGCHGVLEPSAQSDVPGVAAGVVPCPYVRAYGPVGCPSLRTLRAPINAPA